MDQRIEELTINYDNVAKSDWLTSATKSLAKERMINPYKSVGEYFQTLNDEKLQEYLDLANREDEDALSELMLVSEILSRGEGVFSEDMEIIGQNIGYLKMIIAAVALHRKKLVKVNYENISFARDMMDRIIIEKIGDE